MLTCDVLARDVGVGVRCTDHDGNGRAGEVPRAERVVRRDWLPGEEERELRSASFWAENAVDRCRRE